MEESNSVCVYSKDISNELLSLKRNFVLSDFQKGLHLCILSALK